MQPYGTLQHPSNMRSSLSDFLLAILILQAVFSLFCLMNSYVLFKALPKYHLLLEASQSILSWFSCECSNNNNIQQEVLAPQISGRGEGLPQSRGTLTRSSTWANIYGKQLGVFPTSLLMPHLELNSYHKTFLTHLLPPMNASCGIIRP